MLNKTSLKIFGAAAIMILCTGLMTFAEESGHVEIGETLPIWSIIPFVGMLLSIAIFPLVKPEFWEHNQLKVALLWALIFLVPFGIAYGGHVLTFYVLETVLLDYLPFIVLLFGLFVAAGGIVLKGSIAGTTKTNVVMLLIGALLASWVGTTGAAMLMIRPILRANEWREKRAHTVVFFIFMVANIGGCLTPVGDPPLFLGFLRNVPFFWTMRLLPLMILNLAVLTIVYIILDKRYIKKEYAAGRKPNIDPNNKEKIHVEGAHNLIFVAMVVGAVVLSGVVKSIPFFMDPATHELNGINIAGVVMPYNSILEIAIILIAAFLSMKTTKKETREANKFTFEPIAEVARLFIGIFLTMIPALALLKTHGASLGIEHPWQFFWMTGALSSFLDNAPTYLVFLTTAGAMGSATGVATTVGTVATINLMAVSAGAVFMGANTYIGNAPNFMVKSIAEENKVKMPSFFGYMAWSVCILEPLFLLDTLIFFR